MEKARALHWDASSNPCSTRHSLGTILPLCHPPSFLNYKIGITTLTTQGYCENYLCEHKKSTLPGTLQVLNCSRNDRVGMLNASFSLTSTQNRTLYTVGVLLLTPPPEEPGSHFHDDFLSLNQSGGFPTYIMTRHSREFGSHQSLSSRKPRQ